jgi:hypothetical protein
VVAGNGFLRKAVLRMGDRSYWDWVRHVPPGQSPPDELSSPTGVPHVNLLIRMLSSDFMGNDGAEAIGCVITEAARFNMWYAQSVDGKVSSERQAALYTLYRDITHRIYEPWKEYEAACTSGSSEERADREYAKLIRALRSVSSDLSNAQREGQASPPESG